MTKYYRLGDLKQQTFFSFTVAEVGKVKIKVPADLVSNESSFWLAEVFLLAVSSHSRERDWWRQGQRKRWVEGQWEGYRDSSHSISRYFLINTLIMGTPPSWPLLKQVTSLRLLLPVPSHWKSGFQHMYSRRTEIFRSRTLLWNHFQKQNLSCL